VAGGWASERLVGFDIETTGLDVEHDEPVSFAFVEFRGSEPRASEGGYVLPGRSISRGAAAVHGLRRARLVALGAAPVGEAALRIARRLARLSADGVPVVGCNLAYDLTILDRVLSRLAHRTSLRAQGWRGPALDVPVLDRAMDGDFDARPARRLDALCAHYGVRAPGHDAASDAEAAVRVLLAQVRRYPALASSTLAELQADQARWHATWCEARAAQRALSTGQPALFATTEAWPYTERVGAR